MNNQHFPWLVLVPRREGLRELFELADTDYQAMMDEVRTVTRLFAGLTGADKMNVATLGNQVPQLHIHIIARFTSDAAWPNPVWNAGVPPAPYSASELALQVNVMKDAISTL